MHKLEENDLIMTYELYDNIELNFYRKMINYIINFPIDWYNFLEYIIKNKFITSYKDKTLIFTIDLITPQLQNSFDNIINIVNQSNVIVKKVKTKGFLIIELYSNNICEFFKRSGCWLEYLTTYACSEIGINTYRKVNFIINDFINTEVDVLVKVKNKLILIACEDSNNSIKNYLKHSDKLIDSYIKNIDYLNIYTKNQICSNNNQNNKSIKYNYNYFNFLNSLIIYFNSFNIIDKDLYEYNII